MEDKYTKIIDKLSKALGSKINKGFSLDNKVYVSIEKVYDTNSRGTERGICGYGETYEEACHNYLDMLCAAKNPVGKGYITIDTSEFEEFREKETDKDELNDILKTIKDSGDRTTFDTGAVRDLQGGKGRFDLMPLFNVNELLPTRLYEMDCMYDFVSDGNTDALKKAFTNFMDRVYPDRITAIFELSKHFEEGAKKYGENNWQKGIESKYYINSAGHHLLQYERGDIDEPHDRSFMWNMMCCIWTCEEMPQLNTYGSAFVKTVIKN